jgi:hypothetical protein
MEGAKSTPDYARCFGFYRSQTVQYALAHCLACPRMKKCVRTSWGVDVPRREWRGGRRPAAGWGGRRPPWPSGVDLLPT